MTPEQYKKISAPSEETEQIHLITWCKWAESKYPELEAIYHVPNEGKRSARAGGKLKEMGLKPGVPDICLPVPKAGFCGLYIELKRIGGKPTPEQVSWLELLDAYGHCVAVCQGAEAAEELITAYCEGDLDKLNELRLSGDRKDFDRYRPQKMSKKQKMNFAAAAVALQIIIMSVDMIINGNTTGLSLLPILIVCTLALAAEIAREKLYG